MKRFVYSIVIMVLCLALCSCQISNNEKAETASEDYVAQYIKKLDRMEVIIKNPDTLKPEYKDSSWYQEHMILPDNKTMVSLNEIKLKTHLYNLTTESNLVLNEYDLTDLYLNKSSKQEKFESFYNWYVFGTEMDIKTGSSKYEKYYRGIALGHKSYRDMNGSNFKDKKIKYLTAEESFELEQWIKENPDYELASEEPNYYFLLEILGVENLPEVATEGERIYTFY